MALAGYTDVYTSSDYAERVKDIGAAIQEISDGEFINSGKTKLKGQIAILKEKEAALFSKFDGVSDIATLNSKLEEYRNEVLNLSGAGLFQNFTGILEAENQKKYAAFEAAVKKILPEIALTDEEIKEKAISDLYRKAMKFLNGSFGGKGRFYSESGFINDGVMPGKFTANQRARWDEKIKAEMGSFSKIKEVRDYYDVYLKGGTSEDSITIEATWFDKISKMTPTEARDYYKNNQDGLEEFNEQMKQFIVSKSGATKPELLRQVIDHVISQNGFAFFTGKSVSDITGILGEIQSLYYLARLRGDGLNGVRWKGGTHEGDNGAKPHQDIILEEQFGIQVKNTTKDVLKNELTSGFTDLKLDGFLNRIGIEQQDVKNLFENFYGTLGFNVDFHLDRRKRIGEQYLPGLSNNYQPREAAIYKKNKSTLAGYQASIDKLMSLFSSALMYLDVAENAEKLDANLLFIIGGTAAFTASSILEDLLSSLDNNDNVFRLSVKGSIKDGRNIISALNSGRGGTKTKDFHKSVINDIGLKSSYTFKTA